MKKYKKHIDKYLKILEKDPKSEEALRELGAIYYEQKKFDIARPYFEHYVELYPDKEPRAWASLSFCLNSEDESLTQIKYLKKAVELNKDEDRVLSSHLYGAIARLYWHWQHDAEACIEYFIKMMDFEPKEEQKKEAHTTALAIMFKPNGMEAAKKFLDKFSGKPEAPKPPVLSDEEIKALPYHHSKIPTDSVKQMMFYKKVRKDFEKDLKTNPAYKEYFKQFDSESVKNFIHDYAKYKETILRLSDYYVDEQENSEEKILRRNTEDIFELILQKKLFNKQLLWRANKIEIKEIRICHEFKYWQNNIVNCPFIEEVTEEEVEVMKAFLTDPNFSADTRWFMHGWQDYEDFMEKNEDGDYEYMPEWYEFYDTRMGTGPLLLLPDIRGKKEEEYKQIYYNWKNKQPQEPLVNEPYKGPIVLPHIFGMEPYYSQFIERFENSYIQNLHKKNQIDSTPVDENYSRDDFNDAVTELEHAKIPVYVEGGQLWYEAVIRAAQRYKNNLIANSLDRVYENYKLNLQMIHNGIQVEPKHSGVVLDSTLTLCNTLAEHILKGRELKGEPRNFDY